jgi:uncharacterized RDD family membrane protein YckC
LNGNQHDPAYEPPHQRAPEPGTYGSPQTQRMPQTYGSSPYPPAYPAAPPTSPMPLPAYDAAQPAYGAAVQPYGAAPAPAFHTPPPPPYPAQFPQQALVSAGGRLGALLLDMLLALVTLWIGWFVWSMVTWADGQTPAKKLLGHVVADANTGEAFDWGRMALREFCIKGLLGWLLNTVSISIYFWIDSFMVLGDRQRTLHDRFANSVVRYG